MKLSDIERQFVVTDADYLDWIEGTERPRLRAEKKKLQQQKFSSHKKLSILLPTYNSNIVFLREAIDSVIDQNYPNWQLCIVDDASTVADVRIVLQQYAALDMRISVRFSSVNRGIAVTTNDAIAMADGDYCALLDHDDVLSANALLRVVQYIDENADAEILFSDSDRLSQDGRRVEPFCKPDWNYDLFLGQNFLNHLTVYKTELLCHLGGLREGFEGSQDYELALRAIEEIPRHAIVHIPEILYHWRRVDTSFSGSQLGKAVQSARRAIAAHLIRKNVAAHVTACSDALLYSRVVWPYVSEPLALMVYGADDASVASTLDAWRQVHTGPEIQWHAAVIDARYGAAHLNRWAQGQQTRNIGFIVAGLSAVLPQAWRSLLGHGQRAGVCAVGTKYITTRGVVLGSVQFTGTAELVPNISCVSRTAENTGYFASLLLDREVPALQAGCLLLRRQPFLEAGGWSLDPMRSLMAGVDLTRRMAAQGGNLIWHPFAVVRSGSQQLDHALCAEMNY